MSKVTQTEADLKQHLQEQIGFLETSCKVFDAGDESEAKRLATNVRVLCRDYGSSKSLLKQLKLDRIDFYDTGHPYTPNNLLPFTGLLGLTGTCPPASMVFTPHLDSNTDARWRPFSDWWNSIVVSSNLQGPPGGKNFPPLSRCKIVLRLTNEDGGAHVAPEIDAAYAHIARTPGLGWQIATIGPGGRTRERFTGRAELVSMRQIAHEVLRTLSANSNAAS